MTRRLLVFSLLWFGLGAVPAFAQITGWVTPHVGRLAGGDTTTAGPVYAAPHRARLQPYVQGGVGLLRAEGCVAGCAARFADTVAAATLGGGLQYRFADWVAVRGDVRYVRAIGDHDGLPRRDDSAFDFYRISVGVTFIWAQM